MGLNPTNLRGGLGLLNHIKESIKIKLRGLGLSYYIICCDVQRGEPAIFAFGAM
jgi:hypothetical protein